MLRMIFGMFLVLLVLVPPALNAQPVADWEVDSAHSDVSFAIRHFLTQVPGRFNRFAGTIRFDPEHLDQSSVEFTVQADSIDTKNADRDKHLRSPDFFDVAKYPTLRFESERFEGEGENLRVTGDLTIHGVTRKVTVPVEFLGTLETEQGRKAGFAVDFEINRKDYGISWNRSLDQGGAVLGEEVRIRINIEANGPPQETE